MGNLKIDGRTYTCQWASDVKYDGIRLEILTEEKQVLFDISVPEQGVMTVNTFSEEVPVDLVVAAASIAKTRRST